MMWNLSTGENLKTVPVNETLEDIFVFPSNFPIPGVGKTSGGIYAAVAGDRGTYTYTKLYLYIICY